MAEVARILSCHQIRHLQRIRSAPTGTVDVNQLVVAPVHGRAPHTALAAAPTPAEVEPELAHRINGRILVGHNVGVDWRLLHRRHPAIAPAALIDTLRLARHLKLGAKNSLSALMTQFGLTAEIERMADGSQPHRALWDTTAAAPLLPPPIARAWPTGATLADVLAVAAIDLETPAPAKARARVVQDTLFDAAG